MGGSAVNQGSTGDQIACRSFYGLGTGLNLVNFLAAHTVTGILRPEGEALAQRGIRTGLGVCGSDREAGEISAHLGFKTTLVRLAADCSTSRFAAARIADFFLLLVWELR
jgi:hypothetical protein